MPDTPTKTAIMFAGETHAIAPLDAELIAAITAAAPGDS